MSVRAARARAREVRDAAVVQEFPDAVPDVAAPARELVRGRARGRASAPRVYVGALSLRQDAREPQLAPLVDGVEQRREVRVRPREDLRGVRELGPTPRRLETAARRWSRV